jgi:hypothetical protein
MFEMASIDRLLILNGGADLNPSRDDLLNVYGEYGGADRDRTDDLLNAIQALSQLSYSPKSF